MGLGVSLLREPSFRVLLLMAANFAALGAVIPYLPVWLSRTKELSGVEIGTILAAASLARVVMGPMAAAWAEGQRDRRTPMMVLSVGSLLGYLALVPSMGFLPVFLAAFIANLCFQGMVPFMEAAALRTTRAGPLTYGHVRGIGSVAFIAGNVLGGVLLSAVGSWGPFGWILAGCVLLVVASLFLAREPVEQPDRSPFLDRVKAGLRLVREPRFALLAVAAGLIQSSHGFYYGFASLAWLQQGFGRDVIGWVWALAVVIEIAFILVSARLLGRIPAATLVIAGGVGGLIRWTAFAFAPPLAIVLPLQALHALTFAATHIGSVRLLQEWYGDARGATAQMMFASLALAPLTGLATFAAGPLFDQFGAGGYLAMAGLAALGAALAVTLRLSRHGLAGMLPAER